MEAGTKGVSLKRIDSIQAELNLYSEIRDSIDHLMDILGDMNSLTEDVHVGTNFDALISEIRARVDLLRQGASDESRSEEFRQKIHSVLNEEIERGVCRDLKNALSSQCGNFDVVRALIA